MLKIFADIYQQMPGLCWTLWGSLILITLYCLYLFVSGRGTQSRWIIGAGVIVLGAFGHYVLTLLYEPSMPPTADEWAQSTISTPIPVQEVMVEASNKLADATGVTAIDPDTGKKTVELKLTPRHGLVPVTQFPMDLGEIAGILNERFWALDALWITDPKVITSAAPKTYAALNPTPREPLTDARRKMAITGQRVRNQGYEMEQEFQIWVNIGAADGAYRCELERIPWDILMEIDQMAYVLSGEIGDNAYPHMVRWAKEFLESEGQQWLIVMREFEDADLTMTWGIDRLSADGKRFDDALRTSGPLDGISYGKRAGLFQAGCENTPFHGGGFGANLAILFTGEHYKSFFGEDPVRVARILASMGTNPKWRFQDDPNGASPELMTRIEGQYRRYVSILATEWMTFGGKTHPDKRVTEAIALGFGQVDLSWHFIQDMRHWVALVFPITGNPKIYKQEELDKIFRERRTLPKVLHDKVFADLLKRGPS